MRTAAQWFDIYGESHKNRTNKLIHWVCIPLITLSTLGLLQWIPDPFGDAPLAHWGTAFAIVAQLFYLRMSWRLSLGMVTVSAVLLATNHAITAAGLHIGVVSAAIFFVAWVGQFIGHKIEGKKPSFFQDLQFLLVGPAWLVQAVYRRVGIPVSPQGASASTLV